jgi:hypothetical protein
MEVTSITWTEYGGRVGLKLSARLTADFVVAGISELDDMETSVQLRTAARLAF